MTWWWHHLSHFLIWVIAFYILHAHQMLTAMKIWNIASTRRSGSTLHLRLMLWAEMSFLAGSSLFHTSQRQAPFTWTFTEAVQFKGGAQGQNTGVVTRVMSHCSLWSSLYTALLLRRQSTAALSATVTYKEIQIREAETEMKQRFGERGMKDCNHISQSHLPLWSQHRLHHYLSTQVRPTHSRLTSPYCTPPRVKSNLAFNAKNITMKKEV